MASSLVVAVSAIVLTTGIFASQVAFASPNAKNLMARIPVIEKIEQENPKLSWRALFAGLRAYNHL